MTPIPNDVIDDKHVGTNLFEDVKHTTTQSEQWFNGLATEDAGPEPCVVDGPQLQCLDALYGCVRLANLRINSLRRRLLICRRPLLAKSAS